MGGVSAELDFIEELRLRRWARKITFPLIARPTIPSFMKKWTKDARARPTEDRSHPHLTPSD